MRVSVPRILLRISQDPSIHSIGTGNHLVTFAQGHPYLALFHNLCPLITTQEPYHVPTQVMLLLPWLLLLLFSPCLALVNPRRDRLSPRPGHDTFPGLQLTPRDLPVGTCNDQTPCVNGACCSSVSGLCGYSPAECGAGNCSSNCDAKAECGEYGVAGSQDCPLNVCCSKFGCVLF